MESSDFPQIILSVLPQYNPRKVWLFADYPVESFQNFVLMWLGYSLKRVKFPRYNPRKVLTFRGLSCGRACLSAVKYNLLKVLTFADYLRKFRLFHEYLSQIKIKFKNIFRHPSGAYEVLIHEKTRQKISCYCLFNGTGACVMNNE